MPYRPSGTWFITGASSGLGRAIAEAALARGGNVLLAARRTHLLEEFVKRHGDKVMPYPLDVTDLDQVEAAVAAALDRFGSIDVLVNNAGHGQLGSVEATTDQELRAIFDVHVFGPAALTRAVLPVMRKQHGGAIVQMSSCFGRYVAAGLSAYSASKYALEGLSQTLAAEVAPFGITVMTVEPGAFRTEIFGSGFHHSKELPEYEQTVSPLKNLFDGLNGVQPGDPTKAAEAIVTALASDNPPLRLPLGDDAVDGVREELAAAGKELDAWEQVARATSYAS